MYDVPNVTVLCTEIQSILMKWLLQKHSTQFSIRLHNTKAMAQATQNIATLHRISRERLSSILLSEDSSKVAIIDVRGEDHAGGHIHNSINVPSSALDSRLPGVVDSLVDKEIVVFHCALSQQRGPGAALRYLKERDSQRKQQGKAEESSGVSQESGTKDKDLADFSNTKELELANQGEEVKVSISQDVGAGTNNAKRQQVFVLDGGFVKWQEKYGEDDRLTDNYAPDIWEDYS